MTQDLTVEEVRRMAADIGMTGLAPEHLEQLLRATRAAQARRAALRTRTLLPEDEPAHVFRPGGAEVR